MPCLIFFIFLFIFGFSRLEHCTARYLSSSDQLFNSTTKEHEIAAVHRRLSRVRNENPNSSSADVVFQHTPHSSKRASPATEPPAQDDLTQEQDRNLQKATKGGLIQNKNADTNKSISNVSSSMEPSFDYSDYSRPRTRPPSHN